MTNRELSITERFNQMMTIESQVDFFISNSTDLLAEWEQAGPGFERLSGWQTPVFFNDNWIPVYKIRYGGIADGPNRFRL